MDLTCEIPGLDAVSPGLRAVAEYLAEHKIESEYGRAPDHEVWCEAHRVSGLVALAELPAVLDPALPLSVRRGQADRWLKRLVGEALLARRCQCSGEQHAQHGRPLPCPGHFEADVAELDGKKMCGPCHIAVWQVTHPVPAA